MFLLILIDKGGKMPEIIAFISPKGGCGATFACAGIWYSLAKQGKRVLAVDLCGRRCALDFALGLQNDSIYNVYDAVNGVCDFNAALCASSLGENACFLRGDTQACETDTDELKALLNKSDFEYVLIDLPYDENAQTDMKIADKVILVTDCTNVSVRMCDAFAGKLEWEKVFVVINKIIPEYIENKILPTVDEIADGIGVRPIGLLPWSPSAVASFNCGVENGIADKNLADAFSNTAVRITGGKSVAIDFNTYYDCFKIKKRR